MSTTPVVPMQVATTLAGLKHEWNMKHEKNLKKKVKKKNPKQRKYYYYYRWYAYIHTYISEIWIQKINIIAIEIQAVADRIK